MRLRNKKTGGIFDVAFHSSYKDGKITIGVEVDADPKYPKCNFSDYESLEEFCENWEDYKPAEPLIKDEKVRKAVRAWWDAIDYRIDNLLCIKTSGNTRLEISDGSPKLIYISLFVDKGTLCNIKDRTYYTIDELCGEEE